MLRGMIFTFIILLTFCSNVLAQPDTTTTSKAQGHIWVVAVGVGKYSRKEFQALNYASEGAKKMARVLKEARPENTSEYLLTSDSPDANMIANKSNVISALKDISRKIQSKDLVIFYFCGHGIEDNGQQYLLLMDADLTDKETTEYSCMSLTELREKLEKLGCKGRLVFLDACRESPRTSGGLGSNTPMTKDFLRAGGSWNVSNGQVSATFFGCQAGEKVYYGRQGQSFFTETLVEGLSGKAADPSGQVTLKSLANYVEEKVPQAVVDELGVGVKQQPVILPDAVDTVVLKPSAGYIACPKFDGDFGDLYAERVHTNLAASGEILLVERSMIKAVMAEHKITALTNADAVKIGELVNAKYVLAGESMATPDGQIHIVTRLVEVSTGRNFPGIASEVTFASKDWKVSTEYLAYDLLNKMTGSIVKEEDANDIAQKYEELKVEMAKLETVKPEPPADPPSAIVTPIVSGEPPATTQPAVDPKPDQNETPNTDQNQGQSVQQNQEQNSGSQPEQNPAPQPEPKPKPKPVQKKPEFL